MAALAGLTVRNIACVVAYDGTDFHGYQRQGELRTVQAELERAAGVILKEAVPVAASGRTDTGVHAWGQVINFTTSCTIPVNRISFAFNSVLPPDVVMRAAVEVAPEFHARFSAKAKTYRYRVYNQAIPSPFLRRYTCHIPGKLDVPSMEQAAAHLIGRHDFRSFQSSGSTVQSTVRTVTAAQWQNNGNTVDFVITADGFLYNMVRIIVGTLLEVGRGKLSPPEMAAVIVARDRNRAGPTAVPEGLCLERVVYGTQSEIT